MNKLFYYVGDLFYKVMNSISEEEWSSGRCFNDSSSITTSSGGFVGCSASKAVKRGFVNPLRDGNSNKRVKGSYTVGV